MQRDTPHPRTLTYAALGLSALVLAGCGANGSGSNNFSSLLNNTARSILTARAYDRAVVARQNGDDAGFTRATRELDTLTRKTSPTIYFAVAESLILQAITYETAAQRAKEGSAEQTKNLKLSASAYRRAQRMTDGQFDSNYPMLLNALGYFLADHGTSPADFKEAERLTRLSLEKYAQIEAFEAQTPSLIRDLTNRKTELSYSRAVTRDSVAWALYKQRRYPAAQTEQERAIKEWPDNYFAAPSDSGAAKAELFYHLAAIKAGGGNTKGAVQDYQTALRLKPAYPAAQRALKILKP